MLVVLPRLGCPDRLTFVYSRCRVKTFEESGIRESVLACVLQPMSSHEPVQAAWSCNLIPMNHCKSESNNVGTAGDGCLLQNAILSVCGNNYMVWAW